MPTGAPPMKSTGKMGAVPWFCVRCVFAVPDDDGSAALTYEERLTVWRADTVAAAVARAETEAVDYAAAVGLHYLGLAQAYALADELDDGAEVFSLMRDSPLPPDRYVTAFFDTGTERHAT